MKIDQYLFSLLDTEEEANSEKNATREKRHDPDEPTAPLKKKDENRVEEAVQKSGQSEHIKQGSNVNPSGRIRPPFDFFGITPLFYMLGEKRTSTWIGFLITLIQFSLLGLVVYLLVNSFLNKSSPNITILQEKNDANPFVDLKEGRQMMPITYYIYGLKPS